MNGRRSTDVKALINISNNKTKEKSQKIKCIKILHVSHNRLKRFEKSQCMFEFVKDRGKKILLDSSINLHCVTPVMIFKLHQI